MPARARRFLLPFKVQVVADDSGSKGQGTLLVFGGLMAEAKMWARFSTKWAHCLQQSPAIGNFKLHEAATKSGEFGRMTEAQTKAKLLSLADIVLGYPLISLVIAINLADQQADWDSGGPMPFAAYKRTKAIKNASYAAASAAHPYWDAWSIFVISACYQLWDAGIREPFDFIPDDHPSRGPRTAAWYPIIKETVPEPMRSIMPASVYPQDDKTFMPLQAADMIAGLARMQLEGDTKFSWLDEHLSGLRKSRHSVRIDAGTYAEGREELRSSGHSLPPEARAAFERLVGFPIKKDPGKP